MECHINLQKYYFCFPSAFMNSFIRHHLKVKTIKTSFAGIPIKNNLTSQKKGRAIDQSEWRKEYLVLVRNKFALHCTSHDSPSSNTVPLTYPIYLHPRGGGGTPDFKWQGWSNGGQKSIPKKIPGAKFKRKSHAEFPSHKNFQKEWYITRKMETLVLNTQKTPS